ncbi:MAG: hypothetical protein COA78_30495 [Blastopirellula sp.]|nr:MAG: hypothetical protein COA78_30495 [Blastopirellula sp.]
MQQFMQFAFDNFPLFFLAVFVLTLVRVGYLYWQRKKQGPQFPSRDAVNILFEERWTSGNSDKTLFTKLGGASNCLRVVVTDNELWVTLHFPFNIMAKYSDLDHRINRDQITSVEQQGKLTLITFSLEDGKQRMLGLGLRNAEQFCSLLNVVTECEESGI